MSNYKKKTDYLTFTSLQQWVDELKDIGIDLEIAKVPGGYLIKDGSEIIADGSNRQILGFLQGVIWSNGNI